MDLDYIINLYKLVSYIYPQIETISEQELEQLYPFIDELERLFALEDTPCFAKRYLLHYMVNNKTGEVIEFNFFHYEMLEFLDAPIPRKRGAIGASRGHGKSTLFMFYTSRVVCTAEKMYPVIVSVNFAKAKSYLADVKSELEFNPKIEKDFGNLVGKETWAKEAIITSHNVKLAVHTVKSKIRGEKRQMRRPDLIMVDDCEDDKTVETKEQRDYLYKEWLNKAALKALDAKLGDFVIVGTVIHYDSLLAKLLSPKIKKSWYKKIYRALNIDADGNYYALWEEMKPLQELLEEKEEDPLSFASEYQNEPIDEETQPFRKEWILKYTPDDIKGKNLHIFAGTDPALSDKSTADNSALEIIGVEDSTWNVYVLHSDIKRRTPYELYETIINNFMNYKWLANGIETNAFQKLMKDDLERIAAERNIWPNCVEIKSYSNKEARIRAMSPLFQQGKVFLREDQRELYDQLITNPKGRYDDGPDALKMAIDTAQEFLGKTAYWDKDAEKDLVNLLQGNLDVNQLPMVEI